MTLHTDIPTRSELERLLAARESPCVSIYLATSPITQDAQADRIELKNLAAEAGRQLEAAGADRRVAADVREPLDELVDDDTFWTAQARSLAVFASPASLRIFRLPNRLTSTVEVADRFYVEPLLRAVTFPQAGFVLALAAGSVRLVEVTRDGRRIRSACPTSRPTWTPCASRSRNARRAPGCWAPTARRCACASSRAGSTARCAACSPASSCRSCSRPRSR